MENSVENSVIIASVSAFLGPILLGIISYFIKTSISDIGEKLKELLANQQTTQIVIAKMEKDVQSLGTTLVDLLGKINKLENQHDEMKKNQVELEKHVALLTQWKEGIDKSKN